MGWTWIRVYQATRKINHLSLSSRRRSRNLSLSSYLMRICIRCWTLSKRRQQNRRREGRRRNARRLVSLQSVTVCVRSAISTSLLMVPRWCTILSRIWLRLWTSERSTWMLREKEIRRHGWLVIRGRWLLMRKLERTTWLLRNKSGITTWWMKIIRRRTTKGNRELTKEIGDLTYRRWSMILMLITRSQSWLSRRLWQMVRFLIGKRRRLYSVWMQRMVESVLTSRLAVAVQELAHTQER